MLSRDFNCFKGLLGRRQAACPGFGGDLKVREKRAENVSESVSGVKFWGFLTADIASIQAKVVSGLQAATRLKAGWRSEGGETKVERLRVWLIALKFVLCWVRPAELHQILLDKMAGSFLNSILLSNPGKSGTQGHFWRSNKH